MNRPDMQILSLYFYPRPPRGGRLGALGLLVAIRIISIHALREEGDTTYADGNKDTDIISIHALREEGDFCAGCCKLACHA